MTDIDPARAAALRKRLADTITESGDLRSAAWRDAVETVPRHLFLTEFFRRVDTPGLTLWASEGRDQDSRTWLELTYQNETWVTQLDRRLRPHEAGTSAEGEPTSSSTLPGLVVRMLEDLDVSAGMNVLEIGTGSGYSTALLCHRLGDKHVTSIEYDPGIAADAADALRAAGHRPRLISGDGLTGAPAGAPYDRIIATCSVRTIPRTWIDQARPGGVILATVTGWFLGYGLARLVVDENGSAEGRFLPGTISFMVARPQAAPMLTADQRNRLIAATEQAEPRAATIGSDIRHDWTGRFVAQLAAPQAIWVTMSIDGGPLVDYLADVFTGSWASVTREADGGWTVRQAGPVRLWDDVEAAIGAWRQVGSPTAEHFRIRTDGLRQTVWLDTSAGRLAWTITEAIA